jgi:hypothetical protein
MNGLSLRALSSEQGRTRKYSRNLVASDKDLLCSQKVMVTQKRSPSKKAESASLSYANQTLGAASRLLFTSSSAADSYHKIA